MKIKSLIILILTASSVLAATPKENAAGVAWNDHMYNARYGEIVVVTGGPFTFTGHVYNTLGLNNCPEALWQKLDPALLKKQNHALAVILNGPRYFLMDKASLKKPGPVSTFQGLQARYLATVRISLFTLLRGESRPYAINDVARTSNFVYNKGTTTYQLTAPDGRVFVMQSYSRIVDPKLSESDLPGLGRRLSLPKGWTYRVVKLKAPMDLKATGTAYVTQDTLKNSYQLANP